LKAAVARLSPELRRAWRWWRLPTPPLRNVSLLDVLEIETRCDSDAETSRLLKLMEPLHLAKVEGARRGGQRVVGAIHDGGVDGVRGKRVFDTRAQSMKTLPSSKITNSMMAAFTTSIVRAMISEALARLPADAVLATATTDGFLSSVHVEKLKPPRERPSA
jgi:hypothetical protein